MCDTGGEPAFLTFAEEAPAAKEKEAKIWRILVVDDDEEVHVVTKLVLRHKEVFGRKLELTSKKSAREAMEYLRSERDIACILLDVVMEEGDSGLKVAKFLREEVKNLNTRIVLRTGQPGQAPEGKVILDYAINDYKEKTELTEQKLYTAVVTAIRSYRDILTIEESRKGMRMIVDAASNLFNVKSLDLFASGVLKTLISLLYLSQDAFYGMASGVSGAEIDSDLRIYAGTGKYAGIDERPVTVVLDEAKIDLLRRALERVGPTWEGKSLIVVLRNRDGRRGVIFLEECPPVDDMGLELIGLFCTNVSEAFSSISMYQELEAAFKERELLLREVHHRVRNNLQLLSGLINFALSNSSLPPEETLRQTARRIESMAVVHGSVFGDSKIETVDFSQIMPRLVQSIRTDYDRSGAEIQARIRCSGFALPLSTAIPFGLLATELLSEAYGILSRRKESSGLSIVLESVPGEEGFRFLVEDGGSPGGSEPPFAAQGTIGSQLVSALVDQIGGRLSIEYQTGLRIELLFSPGVARE